MRRILLLVAVVILGLTQMVPASAQGDRPPPDEILELDVVHLDEEACGTYGVEWDIDLTADIWNFFDDQGRLVERRLHIIEDNTVRNTVTGLTLRDGPIDFVQREFYDPETGALEALYVTGTSVLVQRGNERLVDRGPMLIDAQAREFIRTAGPHPIWELTISTFDPADGLPAFCHILRP